jgi:hypothetical protein
VGGPEHHKPRPHDDREEQEGESAMNWNAYNQLNKLSGPRRGSVPRRVNLFRCIAIGFYKFGTSPLPDILPFYAERRDFACASSVPNSEMPTEDRSINRRISLTSAAWSIGFDA